MTIARRRCGLMEDQLGSADAVITSSQIAIGSSIPDVPINP
jgi:hypothetical protein